jgi:PTS system ascorbate-specific IIA component
LRLAPGIALLHARPEDGVKQACLSLITLQYPVKFAIHQRSGG